MTRRSTLRPPCCYRVRWQDWTGHRPGQPQPKVHCQDFADRAEAEDHRVRLRATRGPSCLVAIELGRRKPPQPALNPTPDDAATSVALTWPSQRRVP